MRIFNTLVTFGVGVVTTVIAFTVFIDLSAQGRPVVDVCANAEGTLRLTDPGGPCQAGERLIRLRQPEPEEKKEDDKPPEDPRLKALQDRVKDLEERAAKGR